MLGRVKKKVKGLLRKRLLRGIKPVKTLEFLTSPEYYSELQDLLHISKVEGVELVRIGCERDGGYIMLNDFHAGDTAYSFGISNDVSWDKDMASRGYDVFMYDHTIAGLPEENPRFHWQQLGISDGISSDHRLKTLDELIKNNRHEDKRSMILKMDVEGAEWGFLQQVSSEILSQFSQMAFEFHDMTNPENPDAVLAAFRKINSTHKLIHIHANNYAEDYVSFMGKKYCPTLEMTYALRSKYSFMENYDVNLPLSIDNANTPSLPELELGRWNERVDIGKRITVHVRAFSY